MFLHEYPWYPEGVFFDHLLPPPLDQLLSSLLLCFLPCNLCCTLMCPVHSLLHLPCLLLHPPLPLLLGLPPCLLFHPPLHLFLGLFLCLLLGLLLLLPLS